MKLYRIRYAAMIITILISMATVPAASAQDAPPQVRTQIDYDFGEELTIQADIIADHPVLRATVFYRTANSSTTAFAFADLDGDNGEYAAAVIDLSTAAIPPFANVIYWWQLDFSPTESFSTEPTTFFYRDNRIQWQFLQEDQMTVFWGESTIGFGQSALDITRLSLETITRELALPMPETLSIYIYPSSTELQASLALGGKRWIAGEAHPELGVVLLAVPADENAIISLERVLPHELTHVLLYERMGSSYSNLPGWLNEGLAVMQEQDPDPLYALALQEAEEENRLLPMESLCGTFPYENDTALLAYAESHAFVEYLRDIYGVGGIVRLLDAYQEGASCEGGFERVFMRPLPDLQQEWLNSSFSAPQTILSNKSLLAWLLLLLPSVFGLSLALLLRSSNR